jgi:hypothetical protein
MRYAFSQFGSVEEYIRKQLTAAGIDDTDRFLQQAALPQQRKRLSGQTGISSDELLQLAGLADLVRVKGVGPTTAELMVRSGCLLSVQDLLQALQIDPSNPFHESGRIIGQPQVIEAAEHLRSQLKDHRDQAGVKARLPSTRDLTEIGEEAAELRPRLVVSSKTNQEDLFRKRIKREAKDVLKLSLKSDLRNVGWLGLVVLLMMGVLPFLFTTFTIRSSFPIIQGPVDEVRLEVARTLQAYLVNSLATYGGIVFGLIVIALISMTLSSYVVQMPLALLLFSPAPYQKYYTKRMENRHDRDKRTLTIANGIFAVIGLAALLTALLITFGNLQFSLSDTAWLQYLVIGASIIGLCSAVAVSLPTLVFNVRKMQRATTAGQAGFQRALIYDIASIVRAFLILGIFIQFVIPRVFQFGERIENDVWRARTVDHLRTHADDLNEMEFSGTSEEEARDWLLARIDGLVDEYSVQTQWLGGFLAVLLPLFMQGIVWTLLTTLLLTFLVPYLVVGGWQRGAFYIFLLVATFFLESAIQRVAPAWLLLEPNSTGATLMVVAAIFANALLIDWLYDTLTEAKMVCPGCYARLDTNVSFCSHCGLVQTRRSNSAETSTSPFLGD